MISNEDRSALEDLHSIYAHASDRRDMVLLRSLYTDDAVEHHGAYQGPVDGFIAWLTPLQDYFESVTHIVTNIIASVDGDSAESEARGTAYLRLKGDPPFNLIVINRHFDRYRKVDGRWLFARRFVCVDWAQQFAPAASLPDAVQGIPLGTPDLTDPVYAEVPALIGAIRAGLQPF